MKKFKCVVLGCKVNSYEAQSLTDSLENMGYILTEDDSADIFVIYTCAVTNVAAGKTRRKINSLKEKNPNALICVVGCYVQVNEDSLKEDMDIDIVIGTKYKNQLPKLIENYYKNPERQYLVSSLNDVEFEPLKISKFNKQKRAFLKIQDGCNQYCAYCVIPYARGKERSMELKEAIIQAKTLVNNGHQEIVLAGIHTGRYKDSENNQLIDLLKALVEIEGLNRLRLSSIEINEVTDEIIELMENNPKIARHLHIPIQSANDEILRLMNRPYKMSYFFERIDYIRERLDNISISTDLIVGFPKESDELFKDTLTNLEKINFSFMHVFPYAKKEGTKASLMLDHINDVTKKERVNKVNAIAKRSTSEFINARNNKVLEVLVEKLSDDYYFGHSSEYLPVYFKGSVDLNSIVKVKVIKIEDDKIYGEVI